MTVSRTWIALCAIVLAAPFAAGCTATVEERGGPEVVVRDAPPAERVEAVPVARHGYVWVRGHWRHTGREYVWIAGHWEGVRAGHAWVEGQWVRRPGGWVWVEGHWR